MIASERVYCDFVVWAPTGKLHIERLYPDSSFVEAKLKSFSGLLSYQGKWFTRESSGEIPAVVNKVVDEEDWYLVFLP